jgi:hypothetical protein
MFVHTCTSKTPYTIINFKVYCYMKYILFVPYILVFLYKLNLLPLVVNGSTAKLPVYE